MLEVGELEENDRDDRRGGACADDERRALGLITQQQLQDISLKGCGLCGHAAPAARRGRHPEPRGARLEQPGGLSINGGRNNTINLTYDGVTNLDTGSNTGPFLAPGLDSIARSRS